MKMEKAAKTYKARFVINISELGEDDQLTQCKTMASKFNVGSPFTIFYMNSLVAPLGLHSIYMETLVVVV